MTNDQHRTGYFMIVDRGLNNGIDHCKPLVLLSERNDGGEQNACGEQP
ncbi:MAG TPA: hypothetical protein VN682_12825 [Terriglobales bacterium]|nr:hypothetical protein [Terriglobales bacterium]